MPRGGRRPGAGRKVGSRDRFDKRAAEEAAKEGVQPHLVMYRWGLTGKMEGRKHALSPRERIYCMAQSAPYIVPRLNAVAVTALPAQESKSFDEMGPDEKLELARRLALVLRQGERVADELAKAPEPIRQLPHRPQPIPEQRVERPAPINEYAVELLGRPFPIETFERLARVRLSEIPAAYQPEGAYDVRGAKPRYVIIEAPDAWRRRVQAMGYNLAAA